MSDTPQETQNNRGQPPSRSPAEQLQALAERFQATTGQSQAPAGQSQAPAEQRASRSPFGQHQSLAGRGSVAPHHAGGNHGNHGNHENHENHENHGNHRWYSRFLPVVGVLTLATAAAFTVYVMDNGSDDSDCDLSDSESEVEVNNKDCCNVVANNVKEVDSPSLCVYIDRRRHKSCHH